MQRSSNIGGQAVMEGIMMRAGEKYSIGVRRPDGGIELTVRPYKSVFPGNGVTKVPILRGVISFIDSMVVGISSLMWSAEIAVEEEEEGANGKRATSDTNTAAANEKTGRNEDAETEQAGKAEDLKEKNVAKEKKGNGAFDIAMAGTVIFAIAFSIGLFVLLPYFLAGLLRLLTRILLIPIIAGLAYEFLRLAGSSDHPVVCTLAKPGLALQGLVTREPDEKMVEVAIAAVNEVFDWRKWQMEGET